MSDKSTNWILNLIDRVTAPMNKIAMATEHTSAAVNGVSQSVVKMDKGFNAATGNISQRLGSIQLASTLDLVSRTAQGLSDLKGPGMELSSSLADLSAITGVTGDKLKEIEGYARSSAKAFGGSAAQSAESYKLVLSQLNPEIAKAPKALKEMGDTIATLSKQMGGDTAAATEVLTTAMNQFQVSTADPIAASKEMARMMNVMAAAAQAGSAELPNVKEALAQAGLSAKTANVSFEETNAAIQVLDKAGKKGAEGGVALRNVMSTLAQGRFLPPDVLQNLKAAGVDVNALTDKSKSLADRLIPLKKVINDTALFTKLFGRENSNAAIALVSGTSDIKKLTKEITGTNTAYEQAAIVMDSPAEKAKRLQARVDDLKISLFNGTNGWLGYISVLGDTTRDFSNLVPLFDKGADAIKWLGKQTVVQTAITGVATAAQWLWNAAMDANPIGLIVLAIAALVGIVVVVIKKWNDWGAAMTLLLGPIGLIISAFKSLYDHWDSIKKAFTDDGIIAGLKRIGVVLLDALLYPVQQLLQMLAHIPGLSDLAGEAARSIEGIRANLDLVTPSEKKATSPVNATSALSVDVGKTGGKDLAVPLPITPANTGNSSGTSSISGAGGGGKSISMTINIKNYFDKINTKLDVRKVADEVAGVIADRLRDSAIAI